MPHQVIHRLRRNPCKSLVYCICGWEPEPPPSPEDDDADLFIDEDAHPHGYKFVKMLEEEFFGLIVEFLDLFAGICFIIGSVWFLPELSGQQPASGASWFYGGGCIYLVMTLYSLWEGLHHGEGICSIETWGNITFLIGTLCYFVGTILYWPEGIYVWGISWLKDLMTKDDEDAYLAGTVLFIIGSAFFCIGSYINSLNLGILKGQDWTSRRLLLTVTQSYLVGSVLFLVGSIIFLPDIIEEGEKMEELGAWMYIVGSIFFTLGPVFAIWRSCRYMEINAFGDPCACCGCSGPDKKKTGANDEATELLTDSDSDAGNARDLALLKS
mmetsp:Transcript_58800/g.140173  ORF Transcript_58800/g.140173 Transcript_58800/m.140173 type:complete len:326 (-) Transcript_58800:6-983(-)